MGSRRSRFALGIGAALAAVVLGGPAAGVAGAETCSGTLSGTRDLDSLIVPDRGRCTIGPNAQVSVGGKVDVGSNAVLAVRRDDGDKGELRVRGAMTLDQGSSLQDGGKLTLTGSLTGRPDIVAVVDDAWIGGRVDLSSVSGRVEFEDVAIDGNVEIAVGRGGTLLTKVSVDGDVQIHDKRFGVIAVRDSNMDRLTVVDNVVTGLRLVDNIVSKSLTCARNQSNDAFVRGNLVAGIERLASCTGRG